MTTDVDNYMFGSVLAMSDQDVILSVILSVAVLVLFVRFYHQLFAVTFDESFSRATGLHVDRYNTLLAVLTALTIVLGMRMMGAMLISSLVIFPALTAMRLFKSFRGVILCAAVTAVVCFCVGLLISFAWSTPVGATVVAADLVLFFALLRCCFCTPEIARGDGIHLVRPPPELGKKSGTKAEKNFSFLLQKACTFS